MTDLNKKKLSKIEINDNEMLENLQNWLSAVTNTKGVECVEPITNETIDEINRSLEEDIKSSKCVVYINGVPTIMKTERKTKNERFKNIY